MSSNVEEEVEGSLHQYPKEEDESSLHHYANINFHSEEETKPALPPRPDKSQYERIKEREEDLERIHRRSRELIRGQFEDGPFTNTFRPHRIPMRELEESHSMRRRVKSPLREDYKDFSASRYREAISPCRLMEDELDSSEESVASDLISTGWYPGCYSGGVCSCRDLIPSGQLASQMSVENRLLALEGDKEYLKLQMTAMSDKLLSHHDKVKDLQKSLHKKTEDLASTEDQVQLELLNRSSLETKKLELITEMSGLKLKQTELERENSELRRKLQMLNLTDSLNNNSKKIPTENEVICFKRDSTPSRGQVASSYFQKDGAFSPSSPVNKTKAGHSHRNWTHISNKSVKYGKLKSKKCHSKAIIERLEKKRKIPNFILVRIFQFHFSVKALAKWERY